MFEASYFKNETHINHVKITPDELLEILKAYKEGKIAKLSIKTKENKYLNCESLINNLKL